MQPPEPRPLIAVVGAHRASPELVCIAEAAGTALIDAGFRIVCGGRGGVMTAVCKGAHRSAAYTPGCTIGLLPSLDHHEANPYVDVRIPTGIGLARNALVASAGQVVVGFGGGAGTLSELAMAWQLDRPVVCVDNGEGWSSRLAGAGLDTRRSDQILRATSAQEIVAAVRSLL